MANPYDDLETRVTRIEEEVTQLQERASEAAGDAAAARVLAGGADRDVSEVRAELRAHTRALHALRETQLEQGERITALERRIAALEQRVTELDGEMRAGFAKVNVGIARILVLLGGSETPT